LSLLPLVNSIGNRYNVSKDFQLGVNLLTKDFNGENIAEAVSLFIKSANSGDPASQWISSRMLILGVGEEQNQSQSLKFLKTAAKQGIYEAQYDLGVCHLLRKIDLPDISRRLDDHWDEYPNLYLTRVDRWRGLRPDLVPFLVPPYGSRVPPHLTKKALQNLAESVCESSLAVVPFDPIMVPIRKVNAFRVPSFERAHFLYRKALYNDIFLNLETGINFLQSAAEGGLAAANTLLGNYLFFYERKKSEALSFLQKAAEVDEPEALLTFGHFYTDNRYLGKDLTKALSYFDRAAEIGDAEGIVGKIAIEIDLYGAPKDMKKSIQALCALASLGWPYPTNMLSHIKQLTARMKTNIGKR
jgi:TPR repeat protein